MDYAVNRTYDSKQGRFTQVDPIGMSAASLGSPQTLNLYTYCGNDPINHTDPDGLFFSALFKWIGKIIKIILIAIAVIIAVAAMIAMPALAPTVGYGIFVKAFALSGVLLAQALAPPKIGAIIGVITGLIFSGPGIIVNLAAQASKMSMWQKLLAASSFVGSIANSFAQTKKGKETPAQRRQRLIKSSVTSALWRLKNMPGCKEFTQEEFKTYDPATVLTELYNKGSIEPNNKPGLARTSVGTGSKGIIYLGNNWFDDKTVGNYVGTMNRVNSRTLVLLHELKHAVGTSHYTSVLSRVLNIADRGDDYFYKGIAKFCFGVK